MEKMKLHSPDLTQANIEKIRDLFPDCLTEARDEETGALRLAVDFDQLRQELSDRIVEGPRERYQLDWPGKRQAKQIANAPIAKTLRPCREESVNFDDTKNLFIEGDNLDALKLLQETYLGKVKLIYIDPPYNTGSDFIYKDNFAQNTAEFLVRSDQKDEDGNRLFANTDSNGRFHSDWLSFIYPRLKLAKNLLSDDGAIFISMDEHEVHNLGKICDEIFGRGNFVGELIRKTKSTTNDAGSGFNIQHETCLIYAKSKDALLLAGDEKDFSAYKNPDNDPKGNWSAADPSARTGNTRFPIENPHTGQIDYPPEGRCWGFSESRYHEYVGSGKIKFKEERKPNERGFIFKRYLSEVKSDRHTVNSLFSAGNSCMNQVATKEAIALFDEGVLEYPKPRAFIEKIVKYATSDDDLILDFFAGSSTTAHAVMHLNAEDGGNRRFIMVQIPEECDSKSKAAQAGYATIAEFSKERIRRAGAKILERKCHEDWRQDIGFRTLKIDTSNLRDIKREPHQTEQAELLESIDNFKHDRTGEDLLFEVLVNWGVDLTLPIRRETHNGKTIYFVDDDALIACFDKIDEDLVKTFIADKPLRAVFLDSSFADDAMKANIEQFFQQKSSETAIKVI